MKKGIKKNIETLKYWVETNENDGVVMLPKFVVEKTIKLLTNICENLNSKKQKNNGWIPCEERLPDNDKFILLSFEKISIPLIGRYETDNKGGAFYIGDEDETCISQDMYVNAWQPLPEPYKG